MEIEDSNISCGVKEISGISRPSAVQVEAYLIEAIEDYKDNLYENEIEAYEFPFFLFSDTIDSGGVKILTNFIKEKKLGTVYITRKRVNPNTDNLIEVGIWTVNNKNLKKWFHNYQSKY